jgi:hypothetical protein
MFFASAALGGGLLLVLSSGNENVIQSGAYAVGRAQVYQIANIYAIKMAGVFMMSLSTISLRTRIVPRWIAFLGYALALLLLLTVTTIEWTPLVFPVWVLLISVCILIENFNPALSKTLPSPLNSGTGQGENAPQRKAQQN